MKIAILDSGIDQDKVVRNRINYIEGENWEDNLGHGTLCYNVITNINKDAEIDIYKVLDKNGKSNSKVVCQALDDLIGSDVDIVNMSFSLTGEGKHIQELRRKCLKLKQENKLLICSEQNNVATKSYPADWQEVMGVRGINLEEEDKVLLHDKSNSIFFASGIPVFSKIAKNGMCVFMGNSKATALTTGIMSIMDGRAVGDYKGNCKGGEIITDFDVYRKKEIMRNIEETEIFQVLYKEISTSKEYEILKKKNFLLASAITCNMNLANYYYKVIVMIEKIIGKRIRLESVRMIDFMNLYTLAVSIRKRWEYFGQDEV